MSRFACCSDCSNEDCGERTCVEEGQICSHGYALCETCCAEMHQGEVA